jgi:hypothetical protein
MLTEAVTARAAVDAGLDKTWSAVNSEAKYIASALIDKYTPSEFRDFRPLTFPNALSFSKVPRFVNVATHEWALNNNFYLFIFFWFHGGK